MCSQERDRESEMKVRDEGKSERGIGKEVKGREGSAMTKYR